MKEHFIIYNGRFFSADQPIVRADNRGLRYGDGLFETMRMHRGKIVNSDFHFERLFQGMNTLRFAVPETFLPDYFLDEVHRLCVKNRDTQFARVRLMVFRGRGALLEKPVKTPDYIIETFPLADEVKLNEEGLRLDIFPDVKKSADHFSHLKSNNYLPSVMAGIFIAEHPLDDVLILNSFGRVCESSVANIFLVKDNQILTPPLSEGCVAGTLRRWMLKQFSLKGYLVAEKTIAIDEVLAADELFLTNAIQPIRWVRKFWDKLYINEKTKEIFRVVKESLY